MRAGEAVRLEWTDIDFERRVITLNKPEKRSNPRMWKVSKELIAMLKGLPKEGRRVFGKAAYFTLKHAMWRTRKKLASKPEEIKALLETGFEYICEKDGLMFFRKRK